MLSSKIVSIILFMAAIAALLLSYTAGDPAQSYLFNADALYLPTLFRDLLHDGGHFSDWYLTPAPYFFPDYFLFLGAYVLSPSPYFQIALYAVLQILLTTTILYFLFRAFKNNVAFCLSILTTVLLIWLALIAGKPFLYLLMSAFHYGVFLSGMLCLTLLFTYFDSTTPKQRFTLLIILSGLSFITTLSDALFFLQFLAPLLMTRCITQFLMGKKITNQLLPFLLLVLFGLLGIVTYPLFVTNKTRYSASLGLHHFSTNLHDLLDIFTRIFKQAPFVSMLILGFYILSLARLIYVCLNKKKVFHRVIRRETKNNIRGFVFLSTFTLLSTCAICFATLFITTFNPVDRYFISAFFWPIILIILFFPSQLTTRFNYLIQITTGLMVISLGVHALLLVKNNKLRFDHYPNELACMDRALLNHPTLSHGIAQYWDAKPMQAFSKRSIKLAQHVNNLTEQRWITSKTFFKPTYDFAIIAEHAPFPYLLSKKKLEKLNGPAQQTVSCGKHTLLIYRKNQLQVRPIAHVGDAFQWRGDELNTVIGHYTASGEIESNQKQRGVLSFGPYEPLSAGRYQFEIVYRSAQNKQEKAGHWDVVSSSSNGQRVHANGLLFGTNNHIGKIKQHFTLSNIDTMTVIEIRTWLDSEGSMTIKSLTIQRVK